MMTMRLSRRCKAGARAGILAAALAALAIPPTPAAAQQEFLCADPRGFCSALIRPVCLERIQNASLDNEADAECGGALIAYRACLGDAVACPNVVDPETPSMQPDAQAPCTAADCLEASPPTPIVREAPPDREGPEDERPEERLERPQ